MKQAILNPETSPAKLCTTQGLSPTHVEQNSSANSCPIPFPENREIIKNIGMLKPLSIREVYYVIINKQILG
jgi:hypothetical protein